MSGSLSPEDEEIERAILRYLAAHPEAKDTLEGIAEWWLLREWTTRKYVAVERALRDLVSKDLISESAIGQQTPSYSLNRQKLDEVMSILSEPESQ